VLIYVRHSIICIIFVTNYSRDYSEWMVICTFASTKVLVFVQCVLSVKRLYEIQPRIPVGYGPWFQGFCTGM
jgi:hypothetical protein